MHICISKTGKVLELINNLNQFFQNTNLLSNIIPQQSFGIYFGTANLYNLLTFSL